MNNESLGFGDLVKYIVLFEAFCNDERSMKDDWYVAGFLAR